jgi:hypothetical protein
VSDRRWARRSLYLAGGFGAILIVTGWGDHVVHLVIGVVLIACGLAARRER